MLSVKLPYDQMLSQWSAELNPIIENPLSNTVILPNIILQVGVNVINHRLGRTQQGWFLVDKQAFGDVYRTASFNDKTLTLTATTPMTISLGVF